ncbi:MAG: hypothetical protein J3K34DRAFT_435112 [Monoraphidium minutum]|nr:MAG: hypothetical protein J3K34DRAFT_435112 [Monoraphidium minutum]
MRRDGLQHLGVVHILVLVARIGLGCRRRRRRLRARAAGGAAARGGEAAVAVPRAAEKAEALVCGPHPRAREVADQRH